MKRTNDQPLLKGIDDVLKGLVSVIQAREESFWLHRVEGSPRRAWRRRLHKGREQVGGNNDK